MSTFFRNYFSPRFSPEGEGKAFHSLYMLVNGGGGGAFRIVFMIAVFMTICGLLLSVGLFMVSQKGRQMDEIKGKIVRLMWISLGLGALSGLISLVFNAFNWGF